MYNVQENEEKYIRNLAEKEIHEDNYLTLRSYLPAPDSHTAENFKLVYMY